MGAASALSRRQDGRQKKIWKANMAMSNLRKPDFRGLI
jgi:hypothetical protein